MTTSPRRIVEPRAITRVGDATYLDAWCHTANGDRAFRLDRIVAATELTTPSPSARPSRVTCRAAGSAATVRPWP